MKKTIQKDANCMRFVTFLLREEHVSYTPVKEFFVIFCFNTKGLAILIKEIRNSWKLVFLEHCCDVNSLCI